jgi:hypothetical protein
MILKILDDNKSLLFLETFIDDKNEFLINNDFLEEFVDDYRICDYVVISMYLILEFNNCNLYELEHCKIRYMTYKERDKYIELFKLFWKKIVI